MAPETPLKGSFNVRVGPELHRRAVIAAGRAGMSLNAFVARALEDAVGRVPEEEVIFRLGGVSVGARR